MESVYIETTIISYLVARPSRDLLVAAHQQATHDWWADCRPEFRCYVSQVVMDELVAGDPEVAAKRTRIARALPMLAATSEAERLAEAIVLSGAIPPRAVRDAAHVAIAAVHSISYLLTWNCTHLANAHVLRRMASVCNAAGLSMPVICTPEELME